jgi:peptidoglycan hydrolase CwlO-like protein
MSKSSRIISWRLFVLLGMLALVTVIFLRTTKVCDDPISYRIGKVDERFGITREEFAIAVNMAAAMWGKPLAREIFREDAKGNSVVEINLVYDYRQEATDKLKKLNYNIDKTKNSYEDLKSSFQNLKSEYEQKKTILDGEFNSYNLRINIFNKDVEYWNRREGVAENIRRRLEKEKDELGSLRADLQNKQDDLKRLAETINSMVIVINEIATNINLDLVNYQNTGEALGREFCEGFYEYKNGKQSITIYQFDNDYRLVRVLAHEFGHALRLNHSADPKAVMYRLIQSDTIELSPDDIAAVKARCGS